MDEKKKIKTKPCPKCNGLMQAIRIHYKDQVTRIWLCSECSFQEPRKEKE